MSFAYKAVLFVLLCPAALPGQTPFDTAAADAIARQALATYQTPGLAIVVVRDGEVVYIKGHGVRELGKTAPVTPDTIFALGSLTKAFTAASIGLLVDEGKARWDDPVRKHLAWFRLADPLADRDVTLRDLLCHRTGMGTHHLLWYRAPWCVEESVRKLAFLEPAHSFRAAYDYNNLCYLAAGLAAGATARMPWHEFVQQRLLEPLHMRAAVFTSGAAAKAPDHATPHWRDHGGKLQPVSWYPDDQQIRPSGSLKTSVRDLSRWLRFQLDDGAFEGKRVLAAATLQEMHTPQIVQPPDGRDATQVSYGLGWRIMDHRRQPVWEHGGAVDGFRAHIVLLPKQRAGVAALVNTEDTALVSETCYALADLMLGVKESKNTRSRGKHHKVRKRSGGVGPPERGQPSRELPVFAGTYREPAYGTAKVRHENGQLALSWSSFNVPLRHLRFNTFAVPEDLPYGPHALAGEILLFTLGAEGETVTLRFLGRTFARVPADS